MSVVFHVGADEPPVKPHSIYSDLVNLPDPLKLGLTVRIFNYDAVTLYMRVDGYATGWTFTTNDLGAVASGGNIYRNLDEFGTRAKPAAETTETITVRLRAYTDAGYTDLKWTYERVITVVMIKSDDGSWTQDVINNFDDGTVQGWAATYGGVDAGLWNQLVVATDYVLSPPYSLRGGLRHTTHACEAWQRLYKSFATPNRNKVYAIVDMRHWPYAGLAEYSKNVSLRNGTADVTLVFLGRPSDTVLEHYIPVNRWIRAIAPLPKNTTLEVQILRYVYIYAWGLDSWTYVNVDDFRIISKD